MNKPRIVIVGGGFGGYFSAKYLHKLCRDSVEIEIISNINYFVFQPLLPEVAAGTLNPHDAVTPLRNLLKGVKVRLATVKSINTNNKEITLIQGQKRLLQNIHYDHLIIATGQETQLSLFPGFENRSLTMKTLSDAFNLRNHIIECMEVADVTQFDDLKRRYLTFVVAGGGFSGVETMGEMIEMIKRVLPHYPNIDYSDIRAVLIQRGKQILPEMSPQLGQYARRDLERRGVEVWTETGIHSASEFTVKTTDDRTIEARTIVTTIGNGPSEFVKSLPITLNRGKIPVARTLAVKDLDSVWSLGDSALVPLPNDKETERYAPPTAQFAAKQAKQLAKNIHAVLANTEPQPFEYRSKGMLASLGGYRGVAEIYGMRLTGLLAWVIWRAIYIGMLPGFTTRLRVALNWLFDYFMPRTIVHMSAANKPATRLLHYSKGECIHHANEIPRGFYIVVKGSLTQTLPQAAGKPTRTLNEGDSWGSKAIKEDRLTKGEVIALEDCEILLVKREDFLRLRGVYEPLDKQLDSLGR